MKKKLLSVLLCVSMVAGAAAGCGASKDTGGDGKEGSLTELTLLIDTDVSTAGFEAVVDLAEEKLGITVKTETRPGGSDGDNIVKTRLASGDMADLCLYNSGALLNAINPAEYFIDITDEEFTDRLDDGYKSAVSVDGKVYGIPYQSSQAEGVMYSKTMYQEYGLEVPGTWEEFLSNCDTLKEAGETAILGTFADSWTSQVVFLGDAYNLETDNPDFAAAFDKGEAKWESTKEALRSFEKLEETTPYYNEDYLATTYDDGCDIMANGEAGHWFSLSQALTNIYELYGDQVNDLGFFPVPNDAKDINGMTLWYPAGLFGNKNSDKTEAILEFMEFYVSDEALDAYSEAVLPDGPYCIQDYELPENAYEAVSQDIQPYVDAGNALPALEYIAQVKGSDCPAICQELASGQTTAAEAAQKYDNDCKKQATQLGLDW